MVIKRNICGFYWHTEAWWKCCKPVWLIIATTELDWYMYFTKLSWCAASISHYPFKFCSLEYNHFRGKSKIIFVCQLHHRYPPILLLFNLVSGLMNCRMIQKYLLAVNIQRLEFWDLSRDFNCYFEYHLISCTRCKSMRAKQHLMQTLHALRLPL